MIKGKSKFIIIALIIIISIFGLTYAFYEYYRVGENHQLIVGNIYLKFNEKTDTLDLANVFPSTANKARERDDNFITFTVSGLNTTTDRDIWYEISLNEGDEEEGKNRANPEDLVFDLSEVDDEGNETLLIDAASYDDINAKRIWVEIVHHNTVTEYSKTYKLRMWLSEDVVISDTLEGANYTTGEFFNTYASVKVGVYGDFEEKDLSEYIQGYITYDVNGNTEVTAPPRQAIYANAVTTINATLEDDSFDGWATSADGEVVYRKGDIITETSDVTLYAVWLDMSILSNKLSIELASNLTVVDSDGTRFVYGSDVDNNYVWYSGKLWRIVSINGDGSIKLVTQGNMTTLAWHTSESIDYSTSQIRSWLNNEFLPTLYDVDNLLVSTTWDYTTYSDFPTTKLTTASSVTEKVGLLNVYEFMKTGGTTSSSTTDTFLNTGYYWWTMSPQVGVSYVWHVSIYGYTSQHNSSTNSYGVRPSVNLKSGIMISGGNGEKSTPYTIEGDKETGTTSELLSNRISGEFINFNNTKYRIVGIEEINGQKLTKITMADYEVNSNTLTTSLEFGASSDEITYSPTYGIGLYLQEWYQANSTSETYASTYINDTYKVMIATDQIIWYTGPASSSLALDYTLSKTGTTVETPIGIGYYGEMFSGQFGDGYSYSTNTWLMTKYNSLVVWNVTNFGTGSSTQGPTYDYGVRPSFYLKYDVKITGGNGQPSSPYEISQ